MIEHIKRTPTNTNIEEDIKGIKNAAECRVVGLFTRHPSVQVFFDPGLTQEEKYTLHSKVLEVMRGYGFGSSIGTNWTSAGFEAAYKPILLKYNPQLKG